MFSQDEKKIFLTLYREDDFGFHGLDADLVHGLATVPGVVVLRGRHEGVHVAAFTTGSRIREVDLNKIIGMIRYDLL